VGRIGAEMNEDGSSFVTSEEEEEEFETASSEIVKAPGPAQQTSLKIAPGNPGDHSSDLSSLSSSEEKSASTGKPRITGAEEGSSLSSDEGATNAARGRVGGNNGVSVAERKDDGDESSMSLSDSRSVERTRTLEAPPSSLTKTGKISSREEEEEEEEEEEGESESSEKISSVESSEKARKKPVTSIKSTKLSDTRSAVAVAKTAETSVAGAPAAANKCGPLKCPLEGPVEVDIEDLSRICRCGQSAKFPFCDNSHVAFNNANGTNFGFWPVDPVVLGSTLFVCGCGRSARREAGIPLCDYACRPQGDGDVKVTVAAKAPVFLDIVETKKGILVAAAVTTGAPVDVHSTKQTDQVNEVVKASESPRPASVVIKVVDKLRDSSLVDSTSDGEENGESFVSEDDSVAEVKTQPPLPVSVVVAVPSPSAPEVVVQRAVEKQRSVSVVNVDSSEEDSDVAEKQTIKRELEDQARAMKVGEEKKIREEEERRARKQEEEAERKRRNAEQARVEQCQQDDLKRQQERDDQKMTGVLSKKQEKVALFEEEMRRQEVQMVAKRETVLAEEARLKQQQMKERDGAATEARRNAAIAAQKRRKQQGVETTSKAVVVAKSAAVAVNPKAKADALAPLAYNSKPETLIENDLFDSSDESIYLMWEDGAATRSRALNMSVPAGHEELYVSDWDPSSAAARFLVAKKGIAVRIIVSLPPQARAGTHVLDALPLLILSNGMQVRGGSQILDYLVERCAQVSLYNIVFTVFVFFLFQRYRSSGPVFFSTAPKLRVASSIISNVCDTFLGPLLYLYPSHTIAALAGRPAVPMRSADKQQVFEDHLAQLTIIEGYVTRQGPFLTGKAVATCDALLFPFFVFYTNFCHRLSKVLFEGRPKLKAWYRSMLDDPTAAQIVASLNDTVVKNVNSRKYK
jgi:CDGSH-type Zn-finger protein